MQMLPMHLVCVDVELLSPGGSGWGAIVTWWEWVGSYYHLVGVGGELLSPGGREWMDFYYAEQTVK